MNQPQDMDGPSDDTNPFTADLKSDINLDANPDGVSQIFKEGGDGLGNNRTKIFLLIGALIILGGVGFYILTEDDGYEEDEFAVTQQEEIDDENISPDAEEQNDDDIADADSNDLDEDEETDLLADDQDQDQEQEQSTPEEDLPLEDNSDTEKESMQENKQSAVAAPSNLQPQTGVSKFYDESTEWATFTWEGGPALIKFSRSESMRPAQKRHWVNSGEFKLRRPYPGTWYWQVSNELGASEVRSFVIKAPVLRKISLTSPTEGSTLLGNGGLVSWSGDTRVAFYRAELSNSGWANPSHRFSTSGTQIAISDVNPGEYQIRIGAFSEVSGKWEYTEPVGISVQ